MKNQYQKDYSLQAMLSQRTDLIILIIAGVILAFGVGLAASVISGIFASRPLLCLFVGSIITSGALLFIMWITLRTRKSRQQFSAYFFIDMKKQAAVPLLYYPFASKFSRVLKAILAESNELKAIWDNYCSSELVIYADKPVKEDPTKNSKSSPKIKDMIIGTFNIENDEIADKSESPKIIFDVVEYVIINQLSTHLDSYFSDFKEKDKFVHIFDRQDISVLLLENRVLELLSKPLEEREIFSKVKNMNLKSRDGDEIKGIYRSDGLIFKKFTLILPRGTQISRPHKNTLQIDNKRMEINISIGGIHSHPEIPSEFMELENIKFKEMPHGFMNVIFGSNKTDLLPVNITITFSYRIKPLSLIRKGGWEYYQWIDSFASSFEDNFSFPRYIEKIQWPLLHQIFNTWHRDGDSVEKEKTDSAPDSDGLIDVTGSDSS
ncbi:MAG: hypothetical protein WBM27_11730 [bacterium]